MWSIQDWVNNLKDSFSKTSKDVNGGVKPDTESFCPLGIPMQLALPPITQKNKTNQDLEYKASSRIFVIRRWNESPEKGVI